MGCFSLLSFSVVVALCAVLTPVVRPVEYSATLEWTLSDAFTPSSNGGGWDFNTNVFGQEYFWIQSFSNITFYTTTDNGLNPTVWKNIQTPECPDFSSVSGPDYRTIYSTQDSPRCSCVWSETNRCPYELELNVPDLNQQNFSYFLNNDDPITDTAYPASITAGIAVVNDSSADPTFGCYNYTNAADVANNWCLVDRGACFFVQKAQHCFAAGGVGMIIIGRFVRFFFFLSSSPKLLFSLIFAGATTTSCHRSANNPILLFMLQNLWATSSDNTQA